MPRLHVSFPSEEEWGGWKRLLFSQCSHLIPFNNCKYKQCIILNYVQGIHWRRTFFLGASFQGHEVSCLFFSPGPSCNDQGVEQRLFCASALASFSFLFTLKIVVHAAGIKKETFFLWENIAGKHSGDLLRNILTLVVQALYPGFIFVLKRWVGYFTLGRFWAFSSLSLNGFCVWPLGNAHVVHAGGIPKPLLFYDFLWEITQSKKRNNGTDTHLSTSRKW